MTGLLAASCGTGAGAPSERPAGTPSAGPAASTASASSSISGVPALPETSTPATSAAPTTSGAKAAPVVVLDPGHNGGNAAARAQINRQVPAGRDRMKACNTTGTASSDGYPEHVFAFDVAVRVRGVLADRGVTVVLTRQDDNGVGPCVDRRAAIGNERGADAVVSIHADGHQDPRASGFHIAYSSPPLNAAQGEPSMRLARAVRAGMRSAGFPYSSYLGSDGFTPRDDLGGLNLSERPAVLVECGNMHNPEEAAAMATEDGRQRYADAIADGILRYLNA